MRTPHRFKGSHMTWPFNRPDRYDRITRRIFGRLHRRVAADVATLGLPAGSRVLDVGTGPGRLPLAIATACPELSVEGLDLSADMIATARTLADGKVSYVVGDVAALPYPDASVDLVVSLLSQHHWADVPASLRELRRAVRPGGQIWIYDARLALRAAEATAREVFPGETVRREVVRSGRLPIHLLGRLVVQRSRVRSEAVQPTLRPSPEG